APSLVGGPGGGGPGGGGGAVGGGPGGGRPSGRGRGRPTGRGPQMGSRPSQATGDQRGDQGQSDATNAARQDSPQDGETKIRLPSGFVRGVAADAIYVRPEIASQINGYSVKPDVLQIAIRDTVTIDEFRKVWQKKLATQVPPMELIDYSAVRSGLESTRNVSGQQSQAWAATGMASLAAIFIIFSTLSMGVTERVREFAMLRAIALTRTQIASMIAIESLLLAIIGWLGGLLAGWIMVLVGSRVLPGLFSSGAVLGWTCVLLTGVTVMVGAIGAAVLPAWRAMRIQPLDAMSSRPSTRRLQSWPAMGIVGLALVTLTPTVVFALPLSDATRKWCYSFVTYPMLLIGMILLAPAVVVLVERYVAPTITALLRLDSRMIRTQLSSNLWRSVGATLALSVGLGLYASTQTWGYSMLVPFTPGKWLPDALVAFHPVGLSEEDEPMISEVDGVQNDGVMPLAIEQAKVDWGEKGQPTRLRTGADNAVLCGVDPARAFGDEQPFLNLTFVEGERSSTIDALNAGGSCVIAEDYAMASGLGIGDSLTFIPPSAEHERVEYEIAGIVRLPGWQWVTKFSGVRRHFVRTGTLLFANRSDIQADFHLPRTEFFWVNFQPDANRDEVEASFQEIAQRQSGETFTAEGVGAVQSYRPFARMTTTDNVKKAIKIRADDMIWGMSYLPLITLVVMSLAVANTIIASVRSRTWEFGVMRSVGVTRGQLARMVIAESILIGVAACVLSLSFGLIAGWCGVGMAQFGGWFAGPPSFRIPWTHLGIGFALTLTLCLLAGLWPAIKTGRAEPLGLLQAGRSLQ
ncbi:FtsX-like permease family protein, partial [Rhodopirellula sallentina]